MLPNSVFIKGCNHCLLALLHARLRDALACTEPKAQDIQEQPNHLLDVFVLLECHDAGRQGEEGIVIAACDTRARVNLFQQAHTLRFPPSWIACLAVPSPCCRLTCVPSCRTMIPPALTGWPPQTFTPRRFETESLPFLVEPPPFLCAASITGEQGAGSLRAGRVLSLVPCKLLHRPPLWCKDRPLKAEARDMANGQCGLSTRHCANV